MNNEVISLILSVNEHIDARRSIQKHSSLLDNNLSFDGQWPVAKVDRDKMIETNTSTTLWVVVLSGERLRILSPTVADAMAELEARYPEISSQIPDFDLVSFGEKARRFPGHVALHYGCYPQPELDAELLATLGWLQCPDYPQDKLYFGYQTTEEFIAGLAETRALTNITVYSAGGCHRHWYGTDLPTVVDGYINQE